MKNYNFTAKIIVKFFICVIVVIKYTNELRNISSYSAIGFICSGSQITDAPNKLYLLLPRLEINLSNFVCKLPGIQCST